MPYLLPKPPSNVDNTGSTDTLLHPFLQINQKITYDHQGQYWKGYLGKSEGRYRFGYKRHPNSKKEEWGVDLHNLLTTWIDLTHDGVLQPCHLASSFFCSAASNTITFDPVANLVSAINLHWDCSSSFLQALADAHPNCEVWLQSYCEEKDFIESSMGTFEKLTFSQYRALQEKGC